MKKGTASYVPHCTRTKRVLRTPLPNSVPKGRLSLAQDASPRLLRKDDPVRKGRLKMSRNAILDNLQPSLRDSIVFRDVPRTNVLG
jgi:hypothetical protein